MAIPEDLPIYDTGWQSTRKAPISARSLCIANHGILPIQIKFC